MVRVVLGKERRVAEDLEDAVYPLDPSVRTVPGPHGLVLLITSLSRDSIEKLIKYIHIGKFIRDLKKYDLIIKNAPSFKVLTIIKKITAYEKASVRILGNNTDAFIELFRREGIRIGKRALVEIHIYGSIVGLIIRRTPVEH